MFESARARLASMLLGKQSDAVFQMFMQTIGSRQAPPKGSAELISAYKQSPWLRMVVSKLATSLASVPWAMYRPSSKTQAGVVRRSLEGAGGLAWQKTFQRLKAEGTLIAIDKDPITPILEGPNPALSGLAVRRLTWIWLELKGESFWVLERSGPKPNSPIREVWPVAPHWVQTIAVHPDQSFGVQFYGKRMDVKMSDMLWLKDPDPSDPYGRGTGTGEALGDELDTDEYAAKFLKGYFFNSARPDLVMTVKGAKGDQLTAMRADFENRFRGLGKQHQTFWASADMQVHELQKSMAELEMTGLRTFGRNVVVNTFGVPPEIVGILDNSNRATSLEARRIYAEQVLIPRLDFYRAELQHKLVEAQGVDGVLGYDSPAPGDEEAFEAVLRYTPWAITRGEIRAHVGLPDRGPGDAVYMTPANLGEEPAPAVVVAQQQAALPTAEVKALPARKDFTEQDVAGAWESLTPEHLTSKVRQLWSDELKDWMSSTLDDLGLDPSGFDLLNPKTLDHLDNFAGERINDINTTTREALRDSLLEGVRAGDGIDELSSRVGDVMDLAEGFRTENIARTEVNRSANFGTLNAQKLSGIVDQRAWVGTKDGRERDATDALDGSIVGIDDPFEYEGQEAMHPGDFGDPALDCNCRCTTRAIINGKSFDATTVWRAFDRKLVPWEKAAAAALRRGFAEQRSIALAALRRAA